LIQHTWVAVYAIKRVVTWQFKPRLVATSRHLDVISEVFSLEADEGAVNIWQYA
jgi:hypothetical protein